MLIKEREKYLQSVKNAYKTHHFMKNAYRVAAVFISARAGYNNDDVFMPEFFNDGGLI